jgi:hypothetical protein
MKRMIAIVDLKSGEVSLRSSDTSTLDVPVDFDRDAGVASLLNARVHYASTGGKGVSKATYPRPLSWRIRGEECLVASDALTEEPSYCLSAIDPTEE